MRNIVRVETRHPTYRRHVEPRAPTTRHQPATDVPCPHELIASLPASENEPPVREEHHSFAAYRLFEVWPENFLATCRLLHAKDWLSGGICPLVLSHFPLSEAQVASLPGHVPWRRIGEAIEVEMQRLSQILVEPLRIRGLICVDFVDYAGVLGCGGEFCTWFARSTTLNGAAEEAVRQAAHEEPFLAQTAACCLAIRLPRIITLEELDRAISTIDSLLPHRAFVAASAHLDLDGAADFQISLMGVKPRTS